MAHAKIHRFKPKGGAKIPNLFPLRKHPKDEMPIEVQLKAIQAPPWVTEFPFAASIGRKWAFDLAWPELMLALEIEGGGFGSVVHVGTGAWMKVRGKIVQLRPGSTVRLGGRHNQGAGMQNDCEKYSQAAILGWTVIRVTTTMIRDGAAATLLESAFAMKRRTHEQIEKTQLAQDVGHRYPGRP